MQSFDSQEVKATVQTLFDKALINQDWVIEAEQLRHLVVFLQRMDQFMEETIVASEAAINMVAAYTNEYGMDLYNELLNAELDEDDAAEAVVEGEVVDHDL